jgi:hypothetical protein
MMMFALLNQKEKKFESKQKKLLNIKKNKGSTFIECLNQESVLISN